MNRSATPHHIAFACAATMSPPRENARVTRYWRIRPPRGRDEGATLLGCLRSGRLAVMLGLLFAIGGAAFGQVDLQTILAQTHGKLEWNPALDVGVIESSGQRFSFTPGLSWGLINGSMRVDTGAVSRGQGGAIEFTSDGATKIETALSSASSASGNDTADPSNQGTTSSARPRIAAIIIDPGHGGKDPGTMRDPFNRQTVETPLLEKNIVLKVGLDLYKQLTAEYPSMKIVLTRHDDTYVSLEQRTQIANNIALGPNEAKIFISIHANASLDPAAHGYEVWYLPPSYDRNVVSKGSLNTNEKALYPILNDMRQQEYETESILLGKDVLNGIHGSIGDAEVSRGLKSQEWFVVRNSKMPAVLVELGFVTNPDESKLLASDDYLAKLATGVSSGIESFVNFFDNQSGFQE